VREQVEGIPITRTWIYPATGRNVVKRLANYFSFTLSSLLGLVRISRADVLFVESPPLFLCLSAWLMAALRRQKLCINISDLWPDSVVALGIMQEGAFVHAARWLERWLYQRAWRVCGVTQGIVETLANHKGISSEKLLFLPNGVDTRLFSPRTPDLELMRQFGLGGKKVFAYTGTHGYAQGLDVIIRAAMQIQHRSDVVFLFVGEGPEKDRLRTMAQELSLPNVVFMDAQPNTEMPRIFSVCTACIVPLRNVPLFRDARPSKIFPSLACGKPIIYSGAGEAAILIEEAQCGIVTPPEEAQALAEQVVWLADHPAEAATLGQRGRAFVEREYSWNCIVTRWLQDLDRNVNP
jgi:glycosyltransferase involved in cell wall biosynthesis